MGRKSRKVVGVLVIVAGTLFSCTTSTGELTPTPQKPILMCYVTCPDGYMFRHQHLCRGSKRHFEDILVIGQDEVYGNPSESRWFTKDAAYSKLDVEVGTCHAVIAQIIANRRSEERGVHPGEDEWGSPLQPRQP